MLSIQQLPRLGASLVVDAGEHIFEKAGMMRSLVGMMALVVLASVINCDAVIPAFVKKDIPRVS